ncbi:MAG: glycosyltransferase family 4 protein [Ruminococcaceae bacterium]|nr:glycosyltransferase family 4 protein [Oscillospiraceae bacterium]
MKILVVCQYYHPEQVRITDICEEFVKRGHEVDVITDVPNYPMGVIFDGYKNGKKRDEVINGVNVHRCFTIARRSGVLFRFLNYYSYAFSSTRYAAKLKKEYDAVLVNQLSPVMMACAAVKYKKKHNKKLVYYCLDLWPESLVAGGVKRGSLVYKIFNRISEGLYKNADRILVTSRDFTTYLENQFGIEKDKLSYLPQYAEDMFKPTARVVKDTVDLTFAGNIGVMQSVETIIRAAAQLKDIENLRFNIVGDGISLENCKKLSIELGTENVIFHGRKPLEEMSEYYKNADAMLVTLAKDPLISMTIPGKVQTYMAAGKPIIGAIDGETPKVVEEAGCGFCSPSEDYMALASNIREFLRSDIDELGRNSEKYYLENFEKEKFIDTLLKELGDKEPAKEPAEKTL